MGTDIHLHVERRDESGTWARLDGPSYGGRNYSLFAMLADVRNGFGFAGVDTGDPIVPITPEPRDLPDDVSPDVAKESEDWGVDGHSHSWFTLAELLAVDWTGNRITHRCWARRLRNLPPARPGETDDQFAERLQEAARFLGQLPSASGWGYETCGSSSEGQGASGWRTIEWTESWAESVGSGWLSFLLSLYRLGDPEGTRIVFWFDN